MFTRVLVAAALAASALAPSGVAAAGDLTVEQREGLVQAVDDYKRALESRDAPALVAALPPRVVTEMSDGAAASAVAAEVGERLSRDLQADLAIDPARATFGTAPDGTTFALVPMVHTSIRRDRDPVEVRRTVDGRLQTIKVVTEYETTAWSHVLGIHDDGAWYVVSLIDADAMEALFDAYPVFRDVALPRPRSQMQARSVRVE